MTDAAVRLVKPTDRTPGAPNPPGDFLYVPPYVVHREGNPSPEKGTAIVVRSGTGEPVTNVEGPPAG